MSMRAVVYVPPGRQSSRHRDACTRRAQADQLEIVEFATTAEAARGALDSGRADVVLTATHEHALEVRPELIVAEIPRQRSGPAGLLGLAGAAVSAVALRARSHPVVAAAALAGGLAMMSLSPFVTENEHREPPPVLAEPPATTAPARPGTPSTPPGGSTPTAPAPSPPRQTPAPVDPTRPPVSNVTTPPTEPPPETTSPSATRTPTEPPESPDPPATAPKPEPGPEPGPEPLLLCVEADVLGIELGLCI